MPELPEVQTIVNDLLKEHIVGTKIVKTLIFWPKTIADPNVNQFCNQILDQKILHIERKGKYIFFQLHTHSLLIHLRMSGRLFLDRIDSPFTKHERIRFFLDNGQVIKFYDQRKFGRIYLLRDPTEKLNVLGTDPTGPHFTLPHFTKALHRKMKIKPLLLNQKILAGIGNIYADEALWEAQIHPAFIAKKLSPSKVKNLHQAIRAVLQSAITNQGTSLGHTSANFHGLTGQRGGNLHHLKVYQQKSCPRCQTSIVKITLHGRGTHFCPKCQINNETDL